MAASSCNIGDVYNRVKGYHKKAYEYINKGLEIDEKLEDRNKAVEFYRQGLIELENGIKIDVRQCMDDEKKEKMKRLQDKMKTNLKMTQDRMNELSISASESNKIPQVPKRNDSSATPKDTSDRGGGSKVVPGNKGGIKAGGTSVFVPGGNSKFVPDKKRDTKSGNGRNNLSNGSTNQPSGGTTDKAKLGKKFRGLDKDIVDKILNEVVEDKISISFNDVAGNDLAKESIKEIVIYPMLRPDLYTGLREPTKGVLLFGPPGNGKSLLAKAVAFESKCVFFNITAASLMSKWVGESEKMVRALFTMARELQPCIIFMDEIDALLSARSSGEKDVNRRVLNEFLQEFDGTRSSDSDKILIMGATNRPFELDDAALRRFPKRIYIPLPNQETRFQLLKLLLAKEGNPLKDHEIMKIASVTNHYSSHDLTCLAKEAALEPLRSLDREAFQSISSTDVRRLNFKDFQEALKKVRPALSSKSVQEFNDWNQSYGDVS